MLQLVSRWVRIASVGVAAVCTAGVATAGVHTWDVNEVFTDASGQIQFVELWESAGGTGETGVPGQTMSNGNAAQNFTISGPSLVGPSTNKYYLLGTAAFAALPGAPTPDAIIPPGSLPNFVVSGGATISFGGFDSWATGTVPTDGVNSLTRVSPAAGVLPNTPTNYAGVTGTVNAAPAVPSSSWPTALGMLALLAGTGAVAARRMAREAA